MRPNRRPHREPRPSRARLAPSSMPARRILAALLLLPTLTLALSSCFKLGADFKVNADDTIDGSMVFALSKALPAKDLKEANKSNGIFTTKPPFAYDEKAYEDDKYVGTQVTFKNVPLAQWNELMAASSESQNQSGTGQTGQDGTQAAGGSGEVFAFKREGDTYRLDLNLDEQTKQLIKSSVSGGLPAPDIALTFEFPGKVTDSNGRIDGNKVSFGIDDLPAYAVADAQPSSAGGGLVGWAIKLGLVAVTIAAVGFVLARAGVLSSLPGIPGLRDRRGGRGENDEGPELDGFDGDRLDHAQRAAARGRGAGWGEPVGEPVGSWGSLQPRSDGAPHGVPDDGLDYVLDEQEAPTWQPAFEPVTEHTIEQPLWQGNDPYGYRPPVQPAAPEPQPVQPVQPAATEPEPVQQIAAGWYPTADGLTLRYHDGVDWTEHTAPAQ